MRVVPAPGNLWGTAGAAQRRWRTAIANLSDLTTLQPRPTVGIAQATRSDWVVSVDGTITAADVVIDGRVVVTVASVYAAWEMSPAGRGYADASAHRILSDLSMLMGSSHHRLIVAGDWNILRGYGEDGNRYWKARYESVFDRADALGLRFVGPRAPDGRRADPWPTELPRESLCVPTFHHNRQRPATATRQLDFVFASKTIADHVHVRALNDPDDWGPSDHCRLVIDFDLPR